MHARCYGMITIYIIIIIYFDLIAGCGSLWITDGIWKTVFPHCMFRVEVSYYSYIHQRGNLLIGLSC